jgi:hypothetical protein
MKTLIFFTLLLMLQSNLFAQVNFIQNNTGGLVNMADINGISLVKKTYDADIQGSAFLNNDWANADIQLKSGKWIKTAKAKLNAESNKVHFLDSLGRELIADDGLIIKIVLDAPLEAGQKYIFESGYPPTDGQTITFFYQLVEDGKIKMLNRITRPIETFKNELSGEIRKEFVEHRLMYIYADGQMHILKNDKALMMALMKEQKTAIETYLAENKINFKKSADIQKLVRYYNSL